MQMSSSLFVIAFNIGILYLCTVYINKIYSLLHFAPLG